MRPRTVDWLSKPAQGDLPLENGLRQRKKRLLRQQLSDTATEMFLERGFDNVRIAEIAEACDVSEKTVYNYFPTKESLVLDRWETTPTALLRRLAEPAVTPIDAVLGVLDSDLGAWTSWYAQLPDPVEASAKVRRFVDMIQTTPSLRTYERDMSDRLVVEVAKVLAARIGMKPEDPEPQIAAAALVELWRVQDRSVRRHLETTPPPAQIRQSVSSDVQRAALLIRDGLASFDTLKPAPSLRSRTVRTSPTRARKTAQT
jgi:AcrR family transcriptional regulator